jgi:lipopolysaccharide transport system permease protein
MTPATAATKSGPAEDARSEQLPEPKVVRVERGKRWAATLPELWAAREVLYFMVLRNLKIHYRQTVLGAAWAVLQPLALMGVLVLVAEKLIEVPSEGTPYALFVFAALVPWTFFSNAVTVGAESVVRDMNLVSKVYVPRLIIPIAAVVSLVVDFLIALGLLFVLMALYSTPPQAGAVVWVPALTLLTLAVATAAALWLSALMVMYRDVRWIVPFLLQVLLIATPVAYPSSLVPEDWQLVYALNPMAGVVEAFRAAVLGTSSPATGMLAVSVAVTLVLLLGGFAYFRRVEQIFADVI